jgi:hypothetical protein
MGEVTNSQPVSDDFKTLGQELERELNIRPLGENEQRPDGYYSVDHYLGGALKKPVANPKRSWFFQR